MPDIRTPLPSSDPGVEGGAFMEPSGRNRWQPVANGTCGVRKLDPRSGQRGFAGETEFAHPTPSLLPELAQHFERSGFRVEQSGEVIEVERPDAPDDEQATREVLLHLSVWSLMYPDSVASPS